MTEINSPAAIRSIMSKHGIACRKRFGQNFLVDTNIVNKIISAAELNASDLVVEIGPGLGALTVQAARRAGKVLAVEVDRGLVPVLAEMLQGAGDVEVIQGDALKIDYDQMVEEKTGGIYGQHGKSYKLLANLPYYITTPLLMHLLLGRYNFSFLVIMLQWEVGARLAAEPGSRDYGALSVAVQYFTEPKLLFRVPRTVFYPTPGVDSAVVRLNLRPQPAVAVGDEEAFFNIVRASFGRRRKTLLNSLAGSELAVSRDTWFQIINNAGIDPGRRGETLRIGEFASLTDSFLQYADQRK